MVLKVENFRVHSSEGAGKFPLSDWPAVGAGADSPQSGRSMQSTDVTQ